MSNETHPDNAIGLIRHEDVIQPFMLHNSVMRGRMVRMDNTLGAVLSRHDYPEHVSRMLGEMLMLAAMLSTNLPKDGILTLQIKGDGPVSFMVADAQADGSLRGYANITPESEAALQALAEAEGAPSIQDIVGQGYLAITLDQPDGEPYQGIVPIEGESLSDAITHYFNQSQQLDVMFHIHVSRRIREDDDGRWVSGGIMLERMPELAHDASETTDQNGDENGDEDNSKNWEYHTLLVKTASEEELSDPHLAPSALLYRLFNEGGVWVYDTQPIKDQCRCSRDKIQATLDSLSKDELADMAEEDGTVSVTCQFCSREEVFNVV